jgi:hypothetical protein
VSDSFDGSTLSDEERDYLRASAGIMAAIAESRGSAPGLNSDTIAGVLGWTSDRATAVARQLQRTGLIAKKSHIRSVVAAALRLS